MRGRGPRRGVWGPRVRGIREWVYSIDLQRYEKKELPQMKWRLNRLSAAEIFSLFVLEACRRASSIQRRPKQNTLETKPSHGLGHDVVAEVVVVSVADGTPTDGGLAGSWAGWLSPSDDPSIQTDECLALINQIPTLPSFRRSASLPAGRRGAVASERRRARRNGSAKSSTSRRR